MSADDCTHSVDRTGLTRGSGFVVGAPVGDRDTAQVARDFLVSPQRSDPRIAS